MGINKVQYGNTVLIDLTDATATADKILQGYTAYGRDGSKLTGTATGGGSGDGYVWQDQDGYVHLSDEESTQIEVEALSVTQNGTYTAPSGTAYSPVTVNVSGGGGGLVYETGTFTPSEDVARPTISFSNAHTEPPAIVEMTDVSSSSTISTYSNVSMIYYDVYKLHGSGYPYGTSSTYYGLSQYMYVASSVSSLSGSRTFITETSDYPDDSSVYYPRYWVTETEFHPYTNSTSRYWRAGRTYKWIAVWAPTT